MSRRTNLVKRLFLSIFQLLGYTFVKRFRSVPEREMRRHKNREGQRRKPFAFADDESLRAALVKSQSNRKNSLEIIAERLRIG